MYMHEREIQCRLKVSGTGAYDYLPKPFAVEELLLRTKAVLKGTECL